MKKHSFVKISSLVLAMFIATSFGEDCKSGDDPITGEKRCSFVNRMQTLRYDYKGGEFVDFFATFSYSAERNVIIPKGSQIIFKLKTDEVITLKTIVDASPQSQVMASQYSASVFSRYTFAFKIDLKQLESIATSKIVFIRYPSTDGGSLDYDVKGGGKYYAKEIKKGANCIFENSSIFK